MWISKTKRLWEIFERLAWLTNEAVQWIADLASEALKQFWFNHYRENRWLDRVKRKEACSKKRAWAGEYDARYVQWVQDGGRSGWMRETLIL